MLATMNRWLAAITLAPSVKTDFFYRTQQTGHTDTELKHAWNNSLHNYSLSSVVSAGLPAIISMNSSFTDTKHVILTELSVLKKQ